MYSMNGSTPEGWRYGIRKHDRTWWVYARHASGVVTRAPVTDFWHAITCTRQLLAGDLKWHWLPNSETLDAQTADQAIDGCAA